MAKIQITISAQNAQAIAALQQVAGAAKQSGDAINSSARSGAQGLNQAGKSAEQLGQTLDDVTIIAGGITYVLNKIKEAATVLVKPGIDFYRTMESSRLGVAGILMSMTKLNGQELKLNDALAIADNTFKSLQKSSLEFSLNVEDTSAGFQSIVGPGLAAKMTMDEIANIAVRGTKAVKSFGLDSMQVVQELRSMVTGDINMDSQVSKALGITAAGVAQAKTQVGGLYAYLTEKLSGFLAVGEEIPKTLNGKLERTNTLMKMISAEGFSPFIQLLKSGFDAVNGYLTVTVEETNDFGEKIKVVKLNPELIKGLQDASKYIASLARDGANFAITLANLASGPASLVLSVIKLILDHAAQVTFTLLAWIAVGRLRPILADILLQIQFQLSAFRMLVVTSGAFKATLITTGVVMRSLLVTTGWGVLAVAIGYAADQAFKLYENFSKAGKAKKNYFQIKNETEHDTNLANRTDQFDKPIYNVNSDVNVTGMDKQAFDKMEEFIAALQYMAKIDSSFKLGDVTVTSGYRERGGHISGQKADLSIGSDSEGTGMFDPMTRERIIAIAKQFGIAILDETKKPADPGQADIWGPHLDLDLSGQGAQNVGKGDLTLKNPPDDAEALAKAKIALAEAISNQKLQEYIANLQSQQNQLDQRKQATESGFTSAELPAIGPSEYSRQTALITRQIAEAQIAKMEEERHHLEQLAANNNLSSVESPINLQAQIVQKNTEIATARSKLAESLQQLGFEDSKAQKELMDLVANLEIQLLEERGRTAEVTKLKNDREKQPLVTKLQAENKTGAIDTVNKLYDIRQAKADFEQTQRDLELANSELVITQANLMNELAAGTKSVTQVTDEYVTEYNAKTQDIVADLQRQLDSAVKSGNRDLAIKIRAAIREISDKLSEFFDAVIARIDAELQNEIAMINADRSLTSRQKQDKIDDATRLAYAKKAAEQEKEAKAIRNLPDGDIAEAINLEKSAALNRKLSEIPSLLDKIRESSKQAFEDSLFNFLAEGINQCNSLGSAFRNLASTILSAIQRVYAEALTKNIMSMLGMGKTTTIRPTVNGVTVEGPLKPDGIFAEGGSMDSGTVTGPGTETSDSILAWVSNLRKYIRISDGEYVFRGAAVRKYGKAFLDRLNSGLVPTGMLKAFAIGGSLTERSSSGMQGPQDLTASLTNNNNTTIPLSIMNVLDPGIMGRFMKTREGKKVLLNYIKDDAGTIRRILNVPG